MRRSLIAAALLVFACDPPAGETGLDAGGPVAPPVGDAYTGGNGGFDAGVTDGGVRPDRGVRPDSDGGIDPPPEYVCEPEPEEDCDTPFDANCDGRVNEGCNCSVAERPCYSGDPADLEAPNTGCRMGTQACQLEFYGPCEGEQLPSLEVCDGIDNDCDGVLDEIPDCDNQPPAALCPPDQHGPALAFYDLVGGYEDPDGDAMTRVEWRLLEKPGGSTAAPDPANALVSRMFADLHGGYLLQFEVEDVKGALGRCTTRVDTTDTADMLRIEMVWNVGRVGDDSDVDLHLLRVPDGEWFQSGETGDDCYWRNCKVCDESYGVPDYEQACRELIASYNNDPNRDPPSQVMWSAPLDEDDPRLDLDDVDGNGPENINIRTPRPGTYRLGVHYWDPDTSGDATVSVRIYCGAAPPHELEPVVLRGVGTNGDPTTEFWEVADIAWGGGTCRVTDLGVPGCREICAVGDLAPGVGCPDGRMRGARCP